MYKEVFHMDAITYSTARANLASTMNRVCEDHEPLIITRNGEQSVVMLSLDDYKALEETSYLLRSPANAKRLIAAISQLESGQGVERTLPL
jgi:antitoxin YefM